MARTQSAGLLDLRQFMQAPMGGLFPSDSSPQMQPQGQQMASNGGMVQFDVPSAEQAQMALQSLKDEGHQGYVTPIGPNGMYGFSIRAWKDPGTSSASPARGK